jgi:hypothetical protein
LELPLSGVEDDHGQCGSRRVVAHFPRSLRCGDRVWLQSYFYRDGADGSMRAHDPYLSSQAGARCDATIQFHGLCKLIIEASLVRHALWGKSRSSPRRSFWSGTTRCACSWPDLPKLSTDRYLHLKRRSFAQRRHHPDPAAVHLDDLLGNGETEAIAALSSCA